MKRCRRCGEDKARTEFWVERAGKDGLQSYCKDCKRELGRDDSNRRRDKIRAWEREHTTPCVDCGTLTSRGYLSGNGSQMPTLRCQNCQNRKLYEDAHDRAERLLQMRRDGLSNIEIAQREGISPENVATSLQRSQVARFPELTWIPAPYAAKRGVAA